MIVIKGPGWLNELDSWIYLTTHTSLSPIRRGFELSLVNYKKGCIRLAAASDKVYQLLVHDRWFSPGTLASSTTKIDCHDIAEILLKLALNTINKSINQINSNKNVDIFSAHCTCFTFWNNLNQVHSKSKDWKESQII